VSGAVHPTKARLAVLVAAKYGGIRDDDIAALTTYAMRNFLIFTIFLSALSFSSPETIKRVFGTPEFQKTVHAYLMKRHLGKQLDRVLSRLAKLDLAIARQVVDAEVLESLVKRLNQGGPYLVSKVLLLRAVHRVDPSLHTKSLNR